MYYGTGLAFSSLWQRNTFKSTLTTIATAGSLNGVGAAKAANAASQNANRIVGNKLVGFRGSTGPNPYHALDQAITRGVKPSSVLNTLRNPAATVSQSAGRTAYVSQEAIVVLDNTGQAVTVIGRAQFNTKTIQLLIRAGVTP